MVGHHKKRSPACIPDTNRVQFCIQTAKGGVAVGTKVSALYKIGADRYQLQLHAGDGGLGNFASWVYLAEDVQNVSFLKGGELIITTGLFTLSGVALQAFCQALILHGCSGLVINVGKYLMAEDIGEELLSLCDRCRFPLFTMPWEIRLLDIMQDYCTLIMRSNQSNDLLSGALGTALHQEPVQESTLRILNQHGFATDVPYQVAVVQNLKNLMDITLPLNTMGLQYHLFVHDNHIVLVYALREGWPGSQEMAHRLCYCDGVKVGLSDPCKALTDIGLGYKRARFALAAAVFWKQPAVLFGEMGLFQVLFATSDPGLLKALADRYLGSLEKQDAEHGTDYLPTLRTFLLCDGNMNKTAGLMHTHRNTIAYRMNRIREMLDNPLHDYEVKFNLLLAFYIREYFSI